MTRFEWHSEPVSDHMAVRQIYGFCFDDSGRVLMKVDGSEWNLPGGRPEGTDGDAAASLARECREEVNAVIGDVEYLGFQLVDEEDGSAQYAQVRMIARLKHVGEGTIDPENGRQYGRCLVPSGEVAGLLGWGEVGERQAQAAVELAEQKWGLRPITGARRLKL